MMRAAVSVFVSIVLTTILVSPAFADGTLTLDVPGLTGAGKLKIVHAEVYQVEGDELQVVYQGDAFELVKKGKSSSPATC